MIDDNVVITKSYIMTYTIPQIKALINKETGTSITKFIFQAQLDKDEEPTGWCQHWDNTFRVRVVSPDEVVAQMKVDPDTEIYTLTPEDVKAKGDRAAYKRYTIAMVDAVAVV